MTLMTLMTLKSPPMDVQVRPSTSTSRRHRRRWRARTPTPTSTSPSGFGATSRPTVALASARRATAWTILQHSELGK
jgi:hypothetical protein